MTAAVRGVGTSTSWTSGTSQNLNKPTGVVSGDLMLAALCVNGISGSNVTPPSGWDTVFESTSGSEPAVTYQSLHVFKRVADGTEGATFSFTVPAVSGSGSIIAFSDASSTLDGANTAESTTASTTPAVSFTTTTASILLSFLAIDSGSTVITVPSGWTSGWNNTSGQKSAAAYLTGQGTGNKTATWTLAAGKAYSAWGAGIADASSGGTTANAQVAAVTATADNATVSATGSAISAHPDSATGSVTANNASVSTGGGASISLIAFSDPQADDGGGTTTRITANMDLIRSLGWDEVAFGGDLTNNWTTSQITTMDTALSGGLKEAIHPCMGNHEHDYNWPTGYNYWGAAAGPNSSTTWYSRDTSNGWHLAFLDACGSGPSIASGSAQYNWLHADLDANANKPTLVFWHWGRYSGCSAHGNNTSASAIFQLCLDHPWVEAVISGHQHQYERFARMNNSGAVDATNGVRQFTLPPCGQTASLSNSSPTGLEFYANSTYTGVVRFTLYADRYTWETLVPSGYTPIGDSGTQSIRYPLATTAVSAQAGCATVSTSDVTTKTRSVTGRIILPTQFPTVGTWDSILADPTGVAYIVANDRNGEIAGLGADPIYTTYIANARAAGIKVLYYVDTDSTNKATTQVEANMDAYVSYYGAADGFFIDRASTASGDLGYYQTVYAHAAGAAVVLNFGTTPDETYISSGNACDIACIAEDTDSAMLAWTPPAWISNYPDHRFYVIGYSAPNFPTSYGDYVDPYNIAYFYITDKTDFTTLPTYWEVEQAQAGSGSAITWNYHVIQG